MRIKILKVKIEDSLTIEVFLAISFYSVICACI